MAFPGANELNREKGDNILIEGSPVKQREKGDNRLIEG